MKYVVIAIVSVYALRAKAQIFMPDTAVNTIALESSASVTVKFKSDTLRILDRLDGIVKEDELPHVDILNNSGDQILILIFHPGNPLYAFSEFEIRYADTFTGKDKRIKLKDKFFQTEKGIRLGTTKSELLARIGRPSDTRKENGTEIFEYTTTDIYSGILKKYGQAAYSAIYKLRYGKVTEFHFGFVYQK